MSDELIPAEIIENKIYVIRNSKVMLDSDLANLYGVETRILNRNVKRNIDRFPENFMFQLTDVEWESLRSQFGISNENKGGRRYNPYVFTEYGVVMLSSVLNSKKAIAINIQVVNTFIRLRELALTHKEITQRLDELESRFIIHAKENNEQFQELFNTIKKLIETPKESKNIGFRIE